MNVASATVPRDFSGSRHSSIRVRGNVVLRSPSGDAITHQQIISTLGHPMVQENVLVRRLLQLPRRNNVPLICMVSANFEGDISKIAEASSSNRFVSVSSGQRITLDVIDMRSKHTFPTLLWHHPHVSAQSERTANGKTTPPVLNKKGWQYHMNNPTF